MTDMTDLVDEVSDEEIMADLVDKVKKMEKDREAKLSMAREQLVGQLRVTAEKYRTATGVMEALRVYRAVMGSHVLDVEVEFGEAVELAKKMALAADDMAEKAGKVAYDDMGALLDGFYNERFSESSSPIDSCEFAFSLSLEIMRLDLCRNVGPAAEDIVGFIERSDEEIEDVRAEIQDRFGGTSPTAER